MLKYRETEGVLVNKSHATAYAMVAMFTAYLKEYHTPEFFKESLNAVGALKEIPDFIYELPAFGMKLEPPSIKSENEFSVDTENPKILHFGLSNIKGCPSQNDADLDENLEMFITKNPGVSLKLVEKYAQLGMFKECWRFDNKKGRVHGNRHECLNWISKNGENLQAYNETKASLEEINEQIEMAKLQIASFDEYEAEEKKEMETVLEQLKKDKTKLEDKKTILCDALNASYKERLFVVPDETDKEILENRKWEIDLLSFPFDVDKSMKKIMEIKNPRTFDNLAVSRADNNNLNTVVIPAIVLSVSDLKKTKKGTSVYYEVQLMDKNRNIISRRFDNPPDILDGEFALTINDCRYFTCKTKDMKQAIDKTKAREYADTNERLAMAMANGNRNTFVNNGKSFSYYRINKEDAEKADTLEIKEKEEEELDR